jgi:hypothetical protein
MWIRPCVGILLFLVPVISPIRLAAQVPAGPEFLVTGSTNGVLRSASTDAAGNFVFTWPEGNDVVARRFTVKGTALGAEFRVNSYTTGYQGYSRVAVHAAGDFVVVWSSLGHLGGDGADVFARRFDAAGVPKGDEFRLNTYTTGQQLRVTVAAGAAGGFIAVWDGEQPGDDQLGIFGRRFDAAGAPLGAEFHVNTFTAQDQGVTGVAAHASGSFMVVWTAHVDVLAQLYDAGGAPLGGEFQVNTFSTGFQYDPRVAVDPSGNFVVVWTGDQQDGSEMGVFGQRFDASGHRRGAEFRVNTFTTAYQYAAFVATDALGNFVVTWNDYGQEGEKVAIFGQRFAASGAPRGAEFRVNSYTTGDEGESVLAADALGNFVVVWISDGRGGTYAQRFGGLLPAALAADAPGNGVWEPGEFAQLKPSWRNINGAAQAFGGRLASLTGPPGGLYAIGNDSTSYGTVPDGSAGPCAECYLVAVNNPAPRPVLHWDASAVETITPDAHGQMKRWPLHIGRSFADVDTGGPFYRFIETLLHHGVTGGCTATDYCPLTATTREQMAVFVLVARERAGYAPPACGTPVFADVPASNPFCRFIEELARRNVVSGCGGGNYCPSSPVTREQMAIFTLRTLDPALDPPACGTPVFADVPAGSPFCRWIEELARRNVVTGCGGGNYCPAAPVTREQMGVFISATFGLALYGP